MNDLANKPDEALNSWAVDHSFDAAELADALAMALNEARDEGENFPYLCLGPVTSTVHFGAMCNRVDLVRTFLTDGSSAVEIRLCFNAFPNLWRSPRCHSEDEVRRTRSPTMQTADTAIPTFDGLDFKPHPAGEGILARCYFPNGYGVSVVRFTIGGRAGSYGSEDGLYELGVLHNKRLTYDTPITNDVEGYLSPQRVTELMAEVAALPAEQIS